MALRPSFVVLPISSSSRAHKPTRGPRPICSAASAAHDNALLIRAAEVADYSAGHTAPHPNFGCVIARNDEVVGEGFLYAQGTKCAELQAVEAAGELARGATAYLNMEPGDCYADQTPVSSLVQAGISRVVVGIRHPLGHLRGKAINFFRNEGVRVDVVGEDLPCKKMEKALRSCLLVNAPLLYRAAFHVPFSVLKYAMTLDGKIAAISGDASWVSSRLSRGRVFELRGRSDAIVVGGNTVRQDDPRLTARHGGGHVPVRIVMSKSLNLPEEANLWNTRDAYTIIATQRGARKDIQEKLAKKGVEVVEFDMLNPRDVMEYCCSRGCLSVLWECGGELAAAAIGCGVIHKVYAFIAPKIIGGRGAPSPVGDLGMVQMSQALDLIDVSHEVIGPDILVSGFLHPIPDLSPVIPSVHETAALDPAVSPYESKIIFFYKTWDPFGAFSNFSPHSISMPDEAGDFCMWPTVEHYYQAQKFVAVDNPLAKSLIEEIKRAKSPEEAARIGRKFQREHPELVHPDWDTIKIDVMYRGLRCKFSTHSHLNSLLRSTVGFALVEASPHDLFWGGGRDGEGLNYLGRLLMKLRSEILNEAAPDS
ncbi:riboflavin biosynthesis protein PYRR, chloroplastic [Phalaenopsis equestris]|uniref:riboflavin biosynthesis protein PYRR, chloroplastic n=1 Tax=Phalaenopsis equestris TaxID=78828 RepID=UPI0009E19E79|nr:riboflavin biosynthesis protein PYRR, chloroplastic [Phalaenopsis equestris]XP_020578707.1 riboflavin biosynthesis protein PYRR, chloroplastic [Phalaenopsis equestris]